MHNTIHCQTLNKRGTRLTAPPYPGTLGQTIQATVCQEAWQAWVAHQTMLMNEYRLDPLDPQSRTFLEEEMKQFLFKGEVNKPAGYTPNATLTTESTPDTQSSET